KFHIQTFGCQMNERDSETLAGMLTEMGCTEEPERDKADIVLINTCSVREHADERFFGTLGQLKKIKKQNPGFVVGLCGCMMQQQHIIDRVKTKFPWVDIIFGTHNIHEFPKLISALVQEKEKQIDVWPDGGEIVEGLPSKRKYKFKSFVNITFGCNNFCTYCIVPYTRGRERSRSPEDIVREVRALARDGVKEITLLGQNVNSYKGISSSTVTADAGEDRLSVEKGTGEKRVTTFPQLLYMLNEIEGIERIRFMTSHPKDLSQELIGAFRDCDKLCSHIHLPVQAGSNRVLQRMNRRYTKEKYLELISQLRGARPDIAISTDIIVGFPGETEEDFEETLDLCRKVGFDSAFTFIYSVRKGTPAEKYEDQVPEDVKHERFARLVDVINTSAAEKNKAMEGRICDVLVEGPSKHSPAKGEKTEEGACDTVMMSGRTSGFKLVDFPGNMTKEGQIVKVRITEGKTFSLRGEIAES
ncbi:MAG: tRNA (N6-isopentenyl adenosine(37)-C2)-methylthiotransferase MiaB, partial [Anaerovoracaceae bacterium]|nr:tRNA (N6-isopentenyl adenosine(37)-C2)-methylthiotransferase MiaB [Anaerovoracaceae bacterium]